MQHSFAAKRHSVYRAFALLLTLVLIPAIQPASAAQSTVAGQVSGYATLHSVGIEIRIDGDNNHNARGTLAFRPAGNGAWQPALDLFRVDYTPDSPVKDITDHFNGFAGSIFFLDPGQRYELAVEISDPDGGNTRQTLSISTRPQPRKPTGGRRLHVRPGNGGGTGTAASPFLGIEEAQKHAHPGDTFLLHSGVYSGFDSGGEILLDTPGTSDSYIVWQAAQNASVVFDDPLRIAAGHLWIEGIHVRDHADVDNEYGLRTYNAPDDVVIKGNRFTDFYYSIVLNHGGSNWLITDNTIVGDKDINMPDGPASWGGEGIDLQHTSGHTVAWNRISRVADGISYPLSNTDIFRNEIFDVTDDGIEPDYGYTNIRVWENRISNVRHNAFSFQPMNRGPWYFIRNQVAAPLESTLKIRSTSRVLLAHNLFVGWDNALGSSWPNEVPGILTFHSSNNIWISANDGYAWEHNAGGHQPDWRTHLDYDGFDWGSATYAMKWAGVRYPLLTNFSRATGLQTHGIRISRNSCFTQFEIPMAPPAPMPFQYMALKPGCNAVDAGVVLANINEGYTGNAPDLGPYELGKELPHYGPRSKLFSDGFENP
ncbi:right-handed parallel beta-helix repeat-containing protein [Thiolapillus sp.]|uniref:right-handed parallel beta-helix repeat-containing protein n=1 Tax=Thiolapillus sp. TaxID=2017437 RepID=UPI003AF8AF9A